MILTANARHCFALWERPTARLPDDLKNLFLGACGYGNDETSFSIEYSSARFDEAKEELRDMLSDLL
ncbi:hypothetical protein [Sandaracinobacteroides hominis]|uniref:hypothetical protein n=1 Tax=Sandaracinobacteroides hominis TaxID=2780086 RepID=UPI0018F4817D|nr:hypothetical protein [Sandaracinobacteroides hominis]